MTEETVTQPSNSEPIDINAAVALYVELRDQKAAIAAKAKEESKPYNEGLERLEGVLLQALEGQGARSVATPSGTVYRRAERSATIKDKKAFREYVIANGKFDLLDWKANKVQVFDHIEETKEAVPGVNTSAFMTVGVRRGTEQESNDE